MVNRMKLDTGLAEILILAVMDQEEMVRVARRVAIGRPIERTNGDVVLQFADFSEMTIKKDGSAEVVPSF
jgi:hypothetical protein